jgi:hypothetical protein
MNPIAAGALLSAILVFSTAARGQNPATADTNVLMKQWKAVSSPGPNHKKLEFFAGTWATESRMWTMGPDAEPTVTRGSSEKTMVLGGRFLKEEFSGEVVGMTMTGVGLTGYDNYAKKYVGIWFDDMATTILTMEGHFDREGKTLTMFGKMDEWLTGELGKTVMYVTRIVGPDRFVFEIHDMSIGGTGTKAVEVTYTRMK